MSDKYDRRDFIKRAAAGTVITAIGGYYVIAGDALTREAQAQRLPDGRPRLPPGQRVLTELRPMGGTEGDPSVRAFRLRVTGLVARPLTLTLPELLALGATRRTLDVHCVTGWSLLNGLWEGVDMATLATAAGVRPEARHVIFEGAHGYTANVPLREALAPGAMIVHRHQDRPMATAHGAPARALVPSLYFWKSAKWIEGVRFVRNDEPGFWETRGYHNHGNPWTEERYG